MKTVNSVLEITAKLTMFIGLMSGSAAMAEEVFLGGMISSVTGDHCLDQTLVHLHDVYGDDVEAQVGFVESSGKTEYWMKTNLCEGYMVAVFTKNASCKTVHYGFVPQYMERMWAYGSCAEMLPEDTYPQA